MRGDGWKGKDGRMRIFMYGVKQSQRGLLPLSPLETCIGHVSRICFFFFLRLFFSKEKNGGDGGGVLLPNPLFPVLNKEERPIIWLVCNSLCCGGWREEKEDLGFPFDRCSFLFFWGVNKRWKNNEKRGNKTNGGELVSSKKKTRVTPLGY